ncbi:MAG: cyclophilin family peptidyl-prolyl cis-trans isomerase [Candidatus Aldehydirespiratoraceae bacterium]
MAAAEATAAKDRVRSRIVTYGSLAAVVVLVIVGASILLSDNDDDSPPANEAIDAGVIADDSPVATTAAPEILLAGVVAPAAGEAIDGPTECPAEDNSSERVTSFAETPPMCIDETATYIATVDTTYGEFSIELDASRAPLTVNNFVVLARYGYYDGAPWHRIIPGFVIQGGDAVGTPLGTGNPGYAIDDELPSAGDYQVGSVAMANSGPNTSGSQFFVITGEQGAALPPQYSLFGQVTAGLDVVTAVETTETTVGDAPVDEVIIHSVTILES